MIHKLTLAAALAIVTTVAAPQIASASAAAPRTSTADAVTIDLSLFEQAGYRGRSCRRVFRLCADRWGVGNREFRRCMRRRGC